jgi:hypothetical protein
VECLQACEIEKFHRNTDSLVYLCRGGHRDGDGLNGIHVMVGSNRMQFMGRTADGFTRKYAQILIMRIPKNAAMNINSECM